MKRRLIIRPEAYADLAAAHDWYESKRTGLGAEMSAAVLRKIRDARLAPNSFPIRRDPDIRRVLVDRFPYAVYFMARDDAVIVLAVFHTSQDHNARLGNRLSL
jgi:plasmid stabilization system protein ParE